MLEHSVDRETQDAEEKAGAHHEHTQRRLSDAQQREDRDPRSARLAVAFAVGFRLALELGGDLGVDVHVRVHVEIDVQVGHDLEQAERGARREDRAERDGQIEDELVHEYGLARRRCHAD